GAADARDGARAVGAGDDEHHVLVRPEAEAAEGERADLDEAQDGARAGRRGNAAARRGGEGETGRRGDGERGADAREEPHAAQYARQVLTSRYGLRDNAGRTEAAGGVLRRQATRGETRWNAGASSS